MEVFCTFPSKLQEDKKGRLPRRANQCHREMWVKARLLQLKQWKQLKLIIAASKKYSSFKKHQSPSAKIEVCKAWPQAFDRLIEKHQLGRDFGAHHSPISKGDPKSKEEGRTFARG